MRLGPIVAPRLCLYTDAGGAARFCSFNVLFCPSKKGPNEGRDAWQFADVKPLLLLSASLELCSVEHLPEHTVLFSRMQK